ncbi:hypothetical protein IWZ03DRAFT_116465 [Phyllosticta citriasiana]|uniref:Secreted protein n=1 Tax=Phyllosticta citriasiana TaxID=595635 RepID=A0ABR1KYM0_9PEZI
MGIAVHTYLHTLCFILSCIEVSSCLFVCLSVCLFVCFPAGRGERRNRRNRRRRGIIPPYLNPSSIISSKAERAERAEQMAERAEQVAE